ncbi:hypothetical protein R1T40_05500 [Tritonibacter scottomollicae]|uniref:Intracellular septation protein A n=1 Tax=Tritonibacter scottomollicae TaxID=483013 RepID=A0ABZ0HKY6_TRISK|nr:hypothetical protein [Tritonibacter scottomollicae]WOI34187.1 hypothetical protein R1T40_05500 [Tritonibacter scottomollicae]
MDKLKTSSLQIELLFIGVQALIVLGVLFCPPLEATASSSIETILKLDAAIAPVGIVFVAICYSLGAAVDALGSLVKSTLESTKLFSVPSFDLIMKFRNQGLEKEDIYRRIFRSDFEQRLLRATGLNLLFFGCALPFIAPPYRQDTFLASICIFFGGLMLLAWARRLFRQLKRLRSLVASLG